jgi:outer membrane receptor protein involved in Fe transport
MFVADPPAIAAPADENPLDVIEVVATRPGQAQKIDRRIYRVKQNPQSAQFNGLQLLRGLPAVIITPDDQILLLGAQGVTILEDEREVRGDAIQYLRTLHGSDIERIEIMTNPSAQYAAGTGGVINIVLRKKQEDGVSGSANAEVSSRGRIESGTTIKNRNGKWSYELRAEGKAGRTSKSTYEKLRMVQSVPGGPSTINREEGSGHSSQDFLSLNGKATYELDPRTSIIGDVFAGAGRNPSRGHADFIGLTPDFDSFTERSSSDFKVSYAGVQLSLDQKGKKDGETLKASLGTYGNPTVRQPLRSEFGDGDFFSSDRNRTTFGIFSSADWVHPIGKDKILSVGYNIGYFRNTFDYVFISSDDGRFGPDSRDRFAAREVTPTAYATFQETFGTWTIMPGLRLESIDRKISSPGRPSSKFSRVNLSPTVHIEHPLTKTVNMTLSYSKRTRNPGYEEVSPYPVVTGPLEIRQGNPQLKGETTDAYELNLHYSHKSLEAGVIVYHRETDRIWTNVYSVNDQGLNVFVPVNVGNRLDQGAEIDISTPLFKRVKGTANVNLFNRRVPIDSASGGGDETMFRYTGNATVEWHGEEKGKRPGDIAQVQLTYESASREFQICRDSQYSLNLAYTHSFSPTLSVTANLNGLGPVHYRHRLRALLVQEDYDKKDSLPEFKLKLVKTFGKQ